MVIPASIICVIILVEQPLCSPQCPALAISRETAGCGHCSEEVQDLVMLLGVNHLLILSQ